MAAPVIAAQVTSSESSNTTSHTVSLPTGIQAGDLLILRWSQGTVAREITDFGGFTGLFDATNPGDIRLRAAYREADGTEGSTTTITTSANTTSAHIVERITGAEAVATQPPEVSTGAQGDSGNPDPDSLTPTGGSKDYLWIAIGTERNNAASAGPANYNDNVNVAGNVERLFTAWRALTAASEDPGEFTTGGTEDGWIAATIAVHPAAAAGANTITADLDSLLEAQGLTITGSADAKVEAQGLTETASIDALLEAVLTATASLDAKLKAIGLTQTTAADALLEALALTATASSDAKIQAQGLTETASFDALLEALGLTATASLDAKLRTLGLTRTADADAVLKRFGATLAASLDAAVELQGRTATASLDAVLLFVKSLAASMDAVLTALGLTATADVDALLRAQGLTLAASLDSAVKAQGLTETASADAAVERSGLTLSASLDAFLRALGLTQTVQTDALLKGVGIVATLSLDAVIAGQTEGEAGSDGSVVLPSRVRSLGPYRDRRVVLSGRARSKTSKGG